jgi:hypothetical protein
MNTPKSDIDYLNKSIEIDTIAISYLQINPLFDVEVKVR